MERRAMSDSNVGGRLANDRAAHRAVAIVGVGAVLPDAPDATSFWDNVKSGRYSVSEVPPERWDPELYYDPDPKAPAKSYTKIGGWVREWRWEPLKWRLPIPPRVGEAMDRVQQWAIVGAREALADYGFPERTIDRERTAVILGNAMAGDRHYLTALRVFFPELTRELERAPSFAALPKAVRDAVAEETRRGFTGRLPEITEDTMPGELANVIAGRIAALFDLHGPNFVCDAACASAMAAVNAAIEGLEEGDFDLVITGGVDGNMSPSSFVKFCKIGALSATGTRPYAAGADGFVMGEGAALLVLKRLVDAERDGDRIHAVIRALGGSSDGKGKGITAPNPVGQRLAVSRAWEKAGVSPATVGLIEGHGTSTRVGDVVEVESMNAVFSGLGLAPGSVALGSVKSNLGHLKGAAGAAGLLKATLALRDKVLPPSLHFDRPNPSIDFARSPFRVNTELREWRLDGNGAADADVRRAAVSAFGFGGTNFHAVLEEHVPGRLTGDRRATVAVASPAGDDPSPRVVRATLPAPGVRASEAAKAPPRGALVLGAGTVGELSERLRAVVEVARGGRAPVPAAPASAELAAPERVAIDYADAGELAKKGEKVLQALATDHPGMWKVLSSQGAFHGSGPAPKVAFLYTGQGSQYVDMLADLRRREPVVAATFELADRVMTPLLGRPLSDFVFADAGDSDAVARAEEALRHTAVTQPAVLTVDVALTRLLAEYGVTPDLVMGHSLGEYAALVTAGCLPFEQALEAVSARGREMSRVSVADAGRMAAVFAPLEEVEQVLEEVSGYAVVANVNSYGQAVIGGATAAVGEAVAACQARGFHVRPLAVSHAFHTRIVEPASEPLRRMLADLDLRPARIPVVANVNGELYPMGPDAVPGMIDLLARQIASPVQFVQGLETLYAEGVRLVVEVGPKKALHGFAENVLGRYDDALALFTNHPKVGDLTSFNYALCGLFASGLGRGAEAGEGVPSGVPATSSGVPATSSSPSNPVPATSSGPVPATSSGPSNPVPATSSGGSVGDRYGELGRLFADFLERGFEIYRGGGGPPGPAPAPEGGDEPVVVTGAGLGLPGGRRVFADDNVARILRGEQLIDAIPVRFRQAMADKQVTRLVKSDAGGPRFETIDSASEVIKLAARAGELDLVAEFGFPEDRLPSLDVVTQLAVGAGLEALRDAGIPLALRYKVTTKGTHLPDGWGLPAELRDDTGIIFASAFPGYDAFARYLEGYHRDRARRRRLAELEELRARTGDADPLAVELDRRIGEVSAELEADPYRFDRRFLFRVLAMGHSQFAELIGARGPNTQINSACASTTQAVGLAEDWIRRGRCRRVVIIAADNVTSDHLIEWVGAGFLATGAAATDDTVEEAAIPFDRRRHGMLIGMGAAALVVESAAAARERGLSPIAEVLDTVTANSAFHGTRLDVDHIRGVMERLVADAEARWGVDRHALAQEMVFLSHETYTPARGGSAQAEVDALRHVFGPSADRIVVANTKGFTGHPMAVGIEDVVALKALETGVVPPVPNLKEIDPDLGSLNLSRGGAYPVRYALRLGAGFGSQISMSLMRWVPAADGRRRAPSELGHGYRIADPDAWGRWLSRVSGYERPELEVERRTLRIRDQGPPARDGESVPARPAAQSAPAPAPAQVAPAPAPSTPPPVVVPPAPTATSTPAAVAAPEGDGRVEARVLEIISEKTGYPPEMLDLDLDMEADLGIDTVKQAETFAAIREAYDIPREENLQLRDFPTLQHTIGFVYSRRPDLQGGGAEAAPAPAPVAATTTIALEAVVPAAPEATGDSGVEARVLEIISEKTGYPPEMLDLDLDMEADLGIDTVKQAETFAAIREAYDIPREENLQLRDFPTLQHTIGFVYSRRPDLRGGGGASPAAEAPSATVETAAGEPSGAAAGATTDAPFRGDSDAAAALPRRLPVAVLRPELDRCKDTGVELGEGSRVILLGDRGGVGTALAGRLAKRGVEVLEITGDPGREELRDQLAAWRRDGAVDGVYHLPALDPEGPLAELTPDHWHAAVERRVKLLYETMRALYDDAPFLVAATRLGGRHGYDDAGAVAPLGGAVAGFAKSYKREHPEAAVKVVDFAPSRKTAALAELLIAETLADPGAVEVGHAGGRRWGVGLEERPIGGGEPAMELGSETVYLVTGAAGSIVSAIVADLAATGGTFYLLDLTPEPDPADPDLARFATDRDGLKRDLFERLKASGERATPAQVEQQLAALERRRAALTAVEAVERSGGTAHYRQVDLTDYAAVAAVVDEVRADAGRIDVLLHAAGLEISHRLPDKEPRELDLVFDVKSDGWYHLLRAAGDLPIRATVAFSSIAGRFGNLGQVDYAAANDFLCKSSSGFRTTRPETRGIVLDWTAWGGIGMATRGSIPKMMEQAGIDMLPPEAGIAFVRRELEAPGPGGEVVVAQGLGVMLEPWDDDGGLDPEKLGPAPAGPMVTGKPRLATDGAVEVEAALDPATQPFLDHHRIDGTPVLPGVMGMEAFAEAAALLFPGEPIGSVEGVDFLAPFKLYRSEPRSAQVRVQHRLGDGGVVVGCRLVGSRQLPNQETPQVTTHFTGEVRRSAELPEPPAAEKPPRPPKEGATVDAEAIYRIYFHGPAYQVLEEAWRAADGQDDDGDVIVGRLAADLPPDLPADAPPAHLAPRLVELCFQTAGVYELGTTGELRLPRHLDRVRLLRPPEEVEGRLHALVRPRGHGFDAKVVDERGEAVLTVEGYRTVALPGAVEKEKLEPLRRAMKPGG